MVAPIGDRVAVRMNQLGLTQAVLARRAGLSPSYVSELVNNKRGRRLSVLTAERLAGALQVPVSFFGAETSHMRTRVAGRTYAG